MTTDPSTVAFAYFGRKSSRFPTSASVQKRSIRPTSPTKPQVQQEVTSAEDDCASELVRGVQRTGSAIAYVRQPGG